MTYSSGGPAATAAWLAVSRINRPDRASGNAHYAELAHHPLWMTRSDPGGATLNSELVRHTTKVTTIDDTECPASYDPSVSLEGCRRSAGAVDQRRRRDEDLEPLADFPLALKDVFTTAGKRPRAAPRFSTVGAFGMTPTAPASCVTPVWSSWTRPSSTSSRWVSPARPASTRAGRVPEQSWTPHCCTRRSAVMTRWNSSSIGRRPALLGRRRRRTGLPEPLGGPLLGRASDLEVVE